MRLFLAQETVTWTKATETQYLAVSSVHAMPRRPSVYSNSGDSRSDNLMILPLPDFSVSSSKVFLVHACLLSVDGLEYFCIVAYL